MPETAPHRPAAAAPWWEQATATTSVVVLGTAGFAGSFTHIRRLAESHGQAGWLSWVIAGSVDFVAVAAGFELRRRRRNGEGARWPWFAMLLGVAMTLGANLATATPDLWGYVVAGWPPVAFLVVAGLIETRPTPIRRRLADVHIGPSPTSPVPASTALAEGPSTEDPRVNVMDQLADAIRTTPGWRPDYAALQARTGRSRSWCEKRVAEARALAHAATDDSAATAPPTSAGVIPIDRREHHR
jgi:hypothetical protein